MTQKTLIIKNGMIKLPKGIQRAWKQVEVVIFPSKDTLVVKKVQKPIRKLSEIAERISLSRMSSQEVEKEITSYRQKG